MTHDVFISYSNKDKIVADTVCAKLEEQKIRCWVAPRDIPAGQNFARSIINAIDTCKIFVLIWSVNTNASEHILNEINRAFDQGKPIIPFRIQDVQPTLEMQYYFGRTHWLDALTPPLESHINTLANIILANLGEASQTTPEPVKVVSELASQVPAKEEMKATASPERKSASNTDEIKENKPFPKTKESSKDFKVASHPPGTHSKKTLPILITTGVVVIATAILILSTGGFNAIFPSTQKRSHTPKNVSISPTPSLKPTQETKIPTPSATTVPTITPTPYPDWAIEFSEPILAVIRTREPDFQDDFSTRKSEWYLTNYPPDKGCSYPKIVDKRLILFNKTDCFAFAQLDNPRLHHFVFKADVWVKTNISFDIGFNHNLALSEDGTWSLYNCKKECYITKEGVFPLSTIDHQVIVTFISLDDRNAVYFDGVPVIYYYDYDSPTTDRLRITTNGQNHNSIIPAEIDSFQIWVLDNIDNLPDLLRTQ